MTLNEAIEFVCRDMPAGWRVRICMAKGYAGVELINPDGIVVEESEIDNFLEPEILLHAAVFIARREA